MASTQAVPTTDTGSSVIGDDDFLFQKSSEVTVIAKALYRSVRDLPIISPHGHCDPEWFACNEPFEDPTRLLVTPDHYLLRMLHSHGVNLTDMGIPAIGAPVSKEFDSRKAWQIFAGHYYLFRGTPSGMWMNRVLQYIFEIDLPLTSETADEIYDLIAERLEQPDFRPRALFDRFKIEFLATTEGATDTLPHHQSLARSGWKGRVVSTYRPDDVSDPDRDDFHDNLKIFAEITQQDILTWQGYLEAHRKRRQDFIALGTTATDHGHPTANTENLSPVEAEKLYQLILSGDFDSNEAQRFRGQVLTEMAGMSLEDGLIMQIHPGSFRNHSASMMSKYGRDIGFDIPNTTTYVKELQPLLDLYGNDPRLTLIVFTLDESTYSRELAPLAGVYQALKVGPPWWFHDSPEGMTRYRERITETAGFYNTVGFNDDTRAFLSIPVRHDMARRMDSIYLAKLVSDGRLGEQDAYAVIKDLTSTLPRNAYRIDRDKLPNATQPNTGAND